MAGIGEKGGPGSGHFGHAGRPGKRGGSLPGKVSGAGAGSAIDPFQECSEGECIDVWGQDRFNAWDEGLTGQERDAIRDYSTQTPPFDSLFNDHLRAGADPSQRRYAVDDKILAIDAALAKSRVPNAIIVHRGISCGSDECWATYSGLEVGSEFTDDAFVSTTLDQNQFRSGKVQIQILVPEGKNGAYLDGLSTHESEAEVLLPRGTRFKVLKVEKRGAGRYTSVRLGVVVL